MQRRALESARESLRLIQNQYQAGLVDYLSVAVVDATALNSERNALSLLGTRLVASVNLIVALGGGWEGAPQEAQGAQGDQGTQQSPVSQETQESQVSQQPPVPQGS
ncbi:hypothetical protein D3C73_896600 [compost metagenome]